MLAAVVFIISQVATATPNALKVGFQGFELGQSLDAAKAVPLPATNYGQPRLYCSDSPPASLSFVFKPELATRGLIECVPAQQMHGSLWRASMPVSADIRAEVSLSFLDGRLVEIETSYPSLHATTIGDALNSRFGAPAESKISQIQTRDGAWHDQVVTRWQVGQAAVHLTSPDGVLTRMGVVYRLPEADQLEARLRAAQAAAVAL